MHLASTLGWDTVFALHIADLNATIAQARPFPDAFTEDDAADGISASGRFTAWEVAPGGAGPLLRMCIGVEDAILRMHETELPPRALKAEIELRLTFLEQETDPAPAGQDGTTPADGARRLHLVADPNPADGGAPAVCVLDVVATDGTDLDFLVHTAFKMLLERWLNSHVATFLHVFAAVDLNTAAARDGFAWLKPTHVDYAYVDLSHGDGALAVLCMMEGRSSDGLGTQVVPHVIPEGQRASFLISGERALEKVFLGVAKQLFPGTQDGDFTVSGHRVRTTRDVVPFRLTTKDGASHPSQLSHFDLTLTETDIAMSLTTRTETTPGVFEITRAENFLGMQLKEVDGGQTLAFKDTRPAVVNQWSEHNEAFSIVAIFLTVLSIIGLAVFTLATAGTGLALAGLVVCVLAGVAASGITLSTDIIDEVGRGNAPTFDKVMVNAAAKVQWTGQSMLRLERAEICGSLRLSGHVEPVAVAGATPP
jgi:hypothetical protein